MIWLLYRYWYEFHTRFDILRPMGGQLIKEARRRAGLTQRELAELLGTTQAQIARWELGRTSPPFDRVVDAIRACGFDLAVNIATPDDQHALQIQHSLRMTTSERLDRVAQSHAAMRELLGRARGRPDV